MIIFYSIAYIAVRLSDEHPPIEDFRIVTVVLVKIFLCALVIIMIIVATVLCAILLARWAVGNA